LSPSGCHCPLKGLDATRLKTASRPRTSTGPRTRTWGELRRELRVSILRETSCLLGPVLWRFATIVATPLWHQFSGRPRSLQLRTRPVPMSISTRDGIITNVIHASCTKSVRFRQVPNHCCQRLCFHDLGAPAYMPAETGKQLNAKQHAIIP
jgi:hypothetical protein